VKFARDRLGQKGAGVVQPELLKIKKTYDRIRWPAADFTRWRVAAVGFTGVRVGELKQFSSLYLRLATGSLNLDKTPEKRYFQPEKSNM